MVVDHDKSAAPITRPDDSPLRTPPIDCPLAMVFLYDQLDLLALDLALLDSNVGMGGPDEPGDSKFTALFAASHIGLSH
jgi:hypothetical protein